MTWQSQENKVERLLLSYSTVVLHEFNDIRRILNGKILVRNCWRIYYGLKQDLKSKFRFDLVYHFHVRFLWLFFMNYVCRSSLLTSKKYNLFNISLRLLVIQKQLSNKLYSCMNSYVILIRKVEWRFLEAYNNCSLPEKQFSVL